MGAEATASAPTGGAASSTASAGPTCHQLEAAIPVAEATREFSEASAQVDLSPGLAAAEERRRLRIEIEDARIEKALVEKRAARELRELQALSSAHDEANEKARDPTVVAPAPQQPTSAMQVTNSNSTTAIHHDISSEGEDEHRRMDMSLDEDGEELASEPYPAGLLYVQQVAELEQSTDGLKQDLRSLHESERNLRAEAKEKNALIAYLMRKVKSPELDDYVAGNQSSQPFWHGRQQQPDEQSVEDMERVIEETMEYNIRLRNDIQIMSTELRKALAAEGMDGAP